MNNTLAEKKNGLSGSTLKMIAIITMLIDHIGAVVIEAGLLDVWNQEHFYQLINTEYGIRLYGIDLVLRFIGRIAFPIFCFLLVEGFFHTRNRMRYAGNMLIFALISEIPFNLAVFDQVIHTGNQNVYFTLFLGVVVMEGMERFTSSQLKQLLVAAAGCAAAYFLKTDYSMWGILLIASFYLFRGNKKKQLVMGGLAAAAESASLFFAAAISIVPIAMYNGERGKLKLKYFFYWFYPVHLVILYLVRLICLKEL